MKRRAVANQEMSLNITAMADIFTVILVFLLKSYSTSAINITPSKGVLLPSANAATQTFEALQIEVSQDAILVEGEFVVKLDQHRPSKDEMGKKGQSISLTRALQRSKKRQMLISQNNKSVAQDSKILIIADQKTPYSTIKVILASAALSGYTDFKLAVIRPE